MNRRTIVIDIETLPRAMPVAASSTLGNGGGIDDESRKTALSGDFGRILCIGYSDETGDGQHWSGVLGWNATTQRFTCDERAILTEFWEMMRGFNPNRDRIIGHNIFDFDLRFIYKRSVINRVKPTIELSFARYRSQPIFDTMNEWERWCFGSKTSLDRLAVALGVRSSKTDEVNGARVFDLFEAGEHQAIYEYCLKDVELTRTIYRRITFSDAIGNQNRLVPARNEFNKKAA